MAKHGPGTVIAGKYEIQRELGRGATAVVYEAYHQFLRREVALKILHLHMMTQTEVVERFAREAASLASISHPAIVAVLDAGEYDGRTYMVQELIEGKELEEAIGEGGLTPDDALEIGAQLADGLHAVHQLGVVHRDVKPQNVFLSRKDGRLHVKLVDFGIAKTFFGEALTMPGLTVGTPEFMAPEQAMGQEVDGRTDVFALGAVLFNIATGRVPFDAVGLQDLMIQIAYERAPYLALERPDLPAALSNAVDRALEPKPADRWSTAAAMAAALRG
ncbi:MAG: serine/threonine protein kinase [Sandaracinaceae bacterium]|nr:serine/threonine protein kinase [Sandaracinaceae bacterium]